MALETIDADGCKIMTRTAKMLRTGKGNRYRIRTIDRMAADAFLEAVLLFAHAFQHGFIALVFEQVHVIAPHGIGVFNTALTLAHGDHR